MKRIGIILVSGLLVGAVGFFCGYLPRTKTARGMEHSSRPELAWMKQEYHLTEAQFNEIASLHAAYMPKCMEMCKEIDEKTAVMEKLLLATNVVTPDIKQALAETARVRQECQTAMLEHFYEVSRVMPPEQGPRYLRWVQSRTIAPANLMVSQLTGSQK